MKAVLAAKVNQSDSEECNLKQELLLPPANSQK